MQKEEDTAILIGTPMALKGMELPKPTPPASDYSSNILIRRLPLLGRIHFVNDTMGILTLAFTTFYWIYGTCVGLFIILLPRYQDGQVSVIFIIGYSFIAFSCIVALFRSATTNPGRIPLLEDLSGINTDTWNFCSKCQRKRPHRAHHCRRCQQCVVRMDHHCPWINNCVGEENHFLFLQLLFYALLLSCSAFVLCQLHFWYFPPCLTCDKEAFFIKHSLWFCYLLTIMGVGMGAFMTANLMGQHFNLIMDRTTLENMGPLPPLSEIQMRPEIVAYREICGKGSCLNWLNVLRRRRVREFPAFSRV
ncbi:palmitoyltransferase ZDHHC21-like [Ylistrum balloti]|uniref:palmitoyltransferase ZDHHC21-like n=1 Tax=Ylistrum balloti TaxID=509963 RepID=UPI0029057FB9|nr:palmitoyltransferase ZDHHC21-like [Ylistrum balloti]